MRTKCCAAPHAPAHYADWQAGRMPERPALAPWLSNRRSSHQNGTSRRTRIRSWAATRSPRSSACVSCIRSEGACELGLDVGAASADLSSPAPRWPDLLNPPPPKVRVLPGLAVPPPAPPMPEGRVAMLQRLLRYYVSTQEGKRSVSRVLRDRPVWLDWWWGQVTCKPYTKPPR